MKLQQQLSVFMLCKSGVSTCSTSKSPWNLILQQFGAAALLTNMHSNFQRLQHRKGQRTRGIKMWSGQPSTCPIIGKHRFNLSFRKKPFKWWYFSRNFGVQNLYFLVFFVKKRFHSIFQETVLCWAPTHTFWKVVSCLSFPKNHKSPKTFFILIPWCLWLHICIKPFQLQNYQ